jgi:hypothetical protein
VAVEHRKDKSEGVNARPRFFVTILGGPPRTDPPNTDANYIVTALRQFHEKVRTILA